MFYLFSSLLEGCGSLAGITTGAFAYLHFFNRTHFPLESLTYPFRQKHPATHLLV